MRRLLCAFVLGVSLVAIPTPTSATTPPQNRITGGGVDAALGLYSDCSGRTPLRHDAAAIDTCVTDRQYFVGHNPGVFTPLMNDQVGSIITWWDKDHQPHSYRVIAVRNWRSADGVPPLLQGETATFQTCANWSGTIDRILDAVPA